MSINSIDAAIAAHKAWVHRFKSALSGSNGDPFNEVFIRDDKACDLGKWLLSDDWKTLLSPESIQIIEPIHSTFHEVAHRIATTLNHSASLDEVSGLITELDNLSGQLEKVLLLSRRHF